MIFRHEPICGLTKNHQEFHEPWFRSADNIRPPVIEANILKDSALILPRGNVGCDYDVSIPYFP